MINKYFVSLICLFTLSTSYSQDQQSWSAARPDGHAPISIMGDHTHHKNEVMFSYKFMPMWMEGNLNRSEDISDPAIHENYMVAPQDMQMNMHMIGAMYAPSDNITLMAMAHYRSNTMSLRTKMGVNFNTQSEGLGDFSLAALINMIKGSRQSVHAIVGISIPTGDIDQHDETPMGKTQLAYNMQLGSGTWDPTLGATYVGQTDHFSWGAQTKYTFRLGENSEDYALGNQFSAVGWGAIKASDALSFSGSIRYTTMQSIIGKDADLNPMMMPLFNTTNSERSQTDVGIGVNFYVPKGTLKNLRLAAEVLLPVAQDVNGIQMKNTSLATFGVQYALNH